LGSCCSQVVIGLTGQGASPMQMSGTGLTGAVNRSDQLVLS
jgi:hypothetical protein